MADAAVPAAPSAAPNPPIMQAVQDASTALPSLAAQLASLYATREPLKQSLEILDTEIKRIETLAHQSMAGADVRAFTTTHGALALKPMTVFVASDWTALYDHIQTTGEFDLLNRALTQAACRERGPDALPPGVTKTQFDKFKFTPTKGK